MLIRISFMGALVVLGLGVCAAQRPNTPPPTRPGARPVVPAQPTTPAVAGQVTVTGPVKGAPTGSTFVIATRKGTTTVDASKARVRFRGRFSNVAAIKPGSMVQAKGSMSGSTLMATEVSISFIPGKKK